MLTVQRWWKDRKRQRYCVYCNAFSGKNLTERQMKQHKLKDHGVKWTPGY